jgi:EmrB/QacA subfamily drug resistance transporter
VTRGPSTRTREAAAAADAASDRRRWSALALLCVAQFVDVLGVTIVIVALPAIRESLGFADADIQWVVTVYALVFGGFLVLCGRAADLYGRRRLFIAGLAVFVLGSLACGLAESPASLVLARAFQGLGAAAVVPAALSLLTTTFPQGADRNRALGIWTAAAAGGGAAGFFLGGIITSALGWEWVFFVNVPVGAAALALAPLLLRESRDPTVPARLDLLGAVTVTSGLLLVIYGLASAEDAGLASPTTAGALTGAVVLFGCFRVVEGRTADPLIPLSVFRSRALVGANVAAFVLTAVTSSAGVIGALYLQRVLGYSASATGLALLPFSLAVVVGSFVGSLLSTRIGTRATMASGLLAVSAAMLLISRISAETGLSYLVPGVALAGLGLGCAAVASTAAGTAAAGAREQGMASGLLNTAAQIGTAVGIAALVTLAAARTGALADGGGPSDVQLVDGYRWAFVAGAGVALLGSLAVLVTVRDTLAGGRRGG